MATVRIYLQQVNVNEAKIIDSSDAPFVDVTKTILTMSNEDLQKYFNPSDPHTTFGNLKILVNTYFDFFQKQIQAINRMNQQVLIPRAAMRKSGDITGNKYQQLTDRWNRFHKNTIGKNRLQKFYQINSLFHRALNLALGQIMKTIQIAEVEINGPATGQTQIQLKLFDTTGHERYSFTTESKTSKFKAKFLDVSQNMINLKQATEIIFNEDMAFGKKASLDRAASETLYRYRRSETDPRIKNGNGNHIVLLYLNGTKDTYKSYHVWVNTEGDIKEAYATALLLNRSFPSFSGDLETDVENFLLYYVLMVDSISGLLEGDISVGNIHYAIKAANASVQGIAQMQSLLLDIYNGVINSIEQLKQKQEDLRGSEITKKLRNYVQFVAEDEGNAAIIDIVSGLGGRYSF